MRLTDPGIGNSQTLHSAPSAFSFVRIDTALPRVPAPLLISKSSRMPNVRLFSSESNGRPKLDAESPSNEQSSGLASTLGFQSLSSLFEAPLRRRYSRPDSTAEDQEDARSGNAGVHTKGNKQAPFQHAGFSLPSSSPPEASVSPFKKIENSHQLQSQGSLSNLSGEDQRLDNVTESPIRRVLPRTRLINYQPVFESDIYRRPNASRPAEPTEVSPEKPDSKPWGLSDEESWTMESNENSDTTPPRKEGLEAGVISNPKQRKSNQTRTFNKDGASSERLTHVTSTGEAHMVNVGSKPAVRRVAIAYGIVQFTSPTSLKLIVENANKKGDVLSVARIAGIMAAKRASDIIPLCHPILISKVELDVKLIHPGTRFWGWSPPANKFGCVALQATVESVGPTGVEMEALMAVTGAALTVYDMCKAVDRNMSIHKTELVYKSGGKSGLFVKGGWLRSQHFGEDWFAERGLECPPGEHFTSRK